VVERAILALQAHIERNPEDTVTSLDIKNGYNSLDRKAMLTELFRHRSLHNLWRISHWCYSSPSSLLVTSNGSIAATISSGRGTRQGCVLGGLLFCLTIHPIYRQAISELPDTTATAIIDDFNFACRPRNTSTILDRLNSLLPSLGLELAPAKCNILWPNDTTPPPTSVSNLASHYGYKLHIGVLPTLGSAIGLSAPLLQSFAARTLAKHQLILTTLAHAAMPAQHAFAILRLCLASTPNFLLRTLPPTIVSAGCRVFDQALQSTALAKLQVDPASVPALARQQLTLPLRQGGFGLRSSYLIAPAAYLASLASHLSHISPLADTATAVILPGLRSCYSAFADRQITLPPATLPPLSELVSHPQSLRPPSNTTSQHTSSTTCAPRSSMTILTPLPASPPCKHCMRIYGCPRSQPPLTSPSTTSPSH